MSKRVFSIVISIASAGLLASFAAGEAPSQFRGPSGNGVFSESLPQSWSEESNLKWTVEIPGGGWSSPVSTDGLIFLTTAVSEDDTKPKGFGAGVQSMGDFYRSKAPDKPYSFEVHCLKESDGSLVWKQAVVSRVPPHKIHPSNSYATESPVTDGVNVYAYFASVGVVACLDKEGKQLWSREVGAYKTGNDFGTGSSLALHDGLLFVQCDNEEKSFVMALERATGEEAWRDDRASGTSWASPVIWKNEERTVLVVCGSGTVTGYEPASGEVLWKLTGTGGAYSASPTFDQTRLYLGQSGRTSRGPLVAIHAGASGEFTLDDVADDKLAWVVDNAGPGMCSPVIADGRVYVLSRGILSCHDAETGDQVYKERLKNASSVTSSLWASGNFVYAINESGETSVVEVGDEFKLAGTNSIEGLFWSTPSASDDKLLVRSAGKLYCIGNP